MGGCQATETGLDELVMAWALDADNKPRYILELRASETGRACGCHCASCGATVLAVNAGATEFIRRPHFRHEVGHKHEDCMLATARMALLAALAEDDYLTLPGRHQAARLRGVSAAIYEAKHGLPEERVKLRSVKFSNPAKAVVTLDDGRELHVLLLGGQSSFGDASAAITIVVDDPVLAAMSPIELRAHAPAHARRGVALPLARRRAGGRGGAFGARAGHQRL